MSQATFFSVPADVASQREGAATSAECTRMLVSAGRERLLRELATYAPANDLEREARDRIVAFVRSHETCFERSLAIGHVTGSAWVVDRAGRSTLLTHHRKLDRWLQLGGHADGDPDIRAVALREAFEESGLREIEPAAPGIFDLDVHAIPARGADTEDFEAAHVHYDIRFAYFADCAQSPAASDESHAVAWIPLAEIERYAIDDSVRRLVAKTPALVRAA